jgi:hypothetical protein
MATKPKWLTMREQADAIVPAPLRSSGGTLIAQVMSNGFIDINDCLMTIDEAKLLRDWLTKVTT